MTCGYLVVWIAPEGGASKSPRGFFLYPAGFVREFSVWYHQMFLGLVVERPAPAKAGVVVWARTMTWPTASVVYEICRACAPVMLT